MRADLTEEILKLAVCIKDRTIRNNYATGYAVCFQCSFIHHQWPILQVLKKLYELFAPVWHDCGYDWENMLEWLEKKHIPSMQIIHVEVVIIAYCLKNKVSL
jgi:hypothetical protein